MTTDSGFDAPRTALQVAQEYLDWYDCKQRTVERVVVGLRPKLHLEILCTDGFVVPVQHPPMHEELCKVLRQETILAEKVVAEIERQKKLEGIS